MENPKQTNNVVKIGHNSNRSITQETVEKIANRFLHITDIVMNNLKKAEEEYWEACNKYPIVAKYSRFDRHKKLLPHHVEDARRNAEKRLQRLTKDLVEEEDTLQSALKEKYGIEVESHRQKWNRECEEEDRRILDAEKK